MKIIDQQYKTGEARKETWKVLFTHFKLKLVVQLELTHYSEAENFLNLRKMSHCGQ